ncbi:exosortase/archaeosortase family protein [Nodosilinea sp. E11]|nr:exosortase/archaeosortase family protein [Nodosilinea sp. E11]
MRNPFFPTATVSRLRILPLVGLGLVGLHLALIMAVTGNVDQVVLSLLFWGAIATQVQPQLSLGQRRSPSAQIWGAGLLALLGLVAGPLYGTATAFVRLFPLFAFAGWSLLVRGWRGWCGWQVWALVVALSVPPRTLPLLLETVVGMPLRVTTAAIAAFGLHWLGFEVVQQGSFIQLPAGTVDVEFACTGAALLGLLMQISVLLAAITPGQRVGRLMGFSVAIAALLSVIRVAIMTVSVGDDAVFQFWHGSGGGQIFTLLALAILSYLGLGRSQQSNDGSD